MHEIKDFFSTSLWVTSTFPLNRSPCNFPDLTSLIVAFIVFPKYIPDLYVFLISVRIEFFSSPPSGCATLPSVQLATRSFSRGTNSPHGDFPDETRYSQFRLTVAGIGRQRPHPFCSLSTNRFHVSPRSFHISRISRLISRFKFNFCFFVSFVALDQLANQIKWPSNRLVTVKSFPRTENHFNEKCNFSKR